MMQLCDVPAGATVRIVDVGTDHRLARRLAALGMIAGTEVTVAQAGRGRTVVAARGSRIAVGRAVAARVTVTEER